MDGALREKTGLFLNRPQSHQESEQKSYSKRPSPVNQDKKSVNGSYF